MKRIILVVVVSLMGIFCSNMYGQVNQFPYTEGFDNETFTQGTDVYFITNWFGNYVDGIRIFREETNVRSGPGALGLWPVVEEGEDEEEVEIIAQVDLDLTGLEYVVTHFWVATVATGDMKHVKLYLRLSTNGGQSFGPKLLMGTDPRGFENVDTPYQEFTYALHPEAFLNPDVVLQFMVKAGARKGTAAKVLIDDVYIYAAPEDIFPPHVYEPLINSVAEIELRFSEPVSPETANDLSNYTFVGGISPPEITAAVLSDKHLVTLTLDPGIGIGKYYDLEIANVEDLAGNIMETATAELIYNPLAEGLVITEIMYDEPPVGQNDYLEFIELFNATDEPIELGGLRFKGGIASGNLPEYTLLPGEYWVTAKDAASFTSFFGVPAYEWHGGNLSNDDPESIYIQNTDHHSGIVIDSLTYRKGAPWPAGAGGLGYSMELIDPALDNTDPLNWNDAVNFVGVYQGYDIYASPGQSPVILSVNEESLTNGIKFYPNPVRDILHVQTLKPLTKVEIYSILGDRIKTYTSGLTTIDTSLLSKGMYIVKLYADKDLAFMRIIKN
jgi:Secretion system C-terminal sorting domain/Lamin Tail Domain